ncbi:MAG: IS481 family transposase, partial [Verrucomicrobia bacterium]|nr:IS481 family transposase [Verrucomicrobiota bacterium]
MRPFKTGNKKPFGTGSMDACYRCSNGVADLTLDQLNEATQAWIEMEYNRAVHSELGEAPLHRYLGHRDVGRPCPSSAELKITFTAEVDRTQ